jgi:predicted short-subunit dehydrogenase-like oxidoreductase (DUF2520 family)
MIITVDAIALADLARAEAERYPPRTPERRAAAALWVALTDTKSIDAARRALEGFAAPHVQADALELLGRLAAECARAETVTP